MAKEKQFVFSARTTEEGLRRLNDFKGEMKVSWDDLVIEAVCSRYGLDKAAMAVPKNNRLAEETRSGERQPLAGQTAEDVPAKKRDKGKGKK